MGITAYQNALPPPQTPAVADDDTLTKDFRYLLLALWNRTGQGNGVPTIDPGVSVAGGATYNIIKDWTQFTTVGSGGIAQLPAMAVGTDCIIWNDDTGFALSVRPPAGVLIDLANNYSLAVGKMQWFRCISTTLIKSMQLG